MAAAGEPSPDGRSLAPTKRRYPWGDAPPTPERANLDGGALGTIDVGALPAGDSAFGCRQMIGNVWEWTDTVFGPYPGFTPDMYQDYSQPLFGTTRVLRGGGWATRGRLIRNTWRNYYGPERNDVFAGFRTCAPVKRTIEFHDLHPTPADLAAEVLAGLRRRPRYIPPKFFYDAEGSRLFDAITQTPEYYPTRAELEILRSQAPEIAARVGTGSLLVEPGGGSCAKVRILLEGLRPCAYVPMDISREHLWLAAEQVAAEFPWLEVHAACTDFTRLMELPASAPEGPRVAFFPGSSIGNFDPPAAVDFLAAVAELVGPAASC